MPLGLKVVNFYDIANNHSFIQKLFPIPNFYICPRSRLKIPREKSLIIFYFVGKCDGLNTNTLYRIFYLFVNIQKGKGKLIYITTLICNKIQLHIMFRNLNKHRLSRGCLAVLLYDNK